MDILYSTEGMASSIKRNSTKPDVVQTELFLHPCNDERSLYELNTEMSRLALIKLNDRNADDLFRASFQTGNSSYQQQSHQENKRIITLRENGKTVLESEESGWFSKIFSFTFLGSNYRLIRTLLSRRFVLRDEHGREYGSIGSQSIFSNSYVIRLPENFPPLLNTFLSSLVLCESEEHETPVFLPNSFYG